MKKRLILNEIHIIQNYLKYKCVILVCQISNFKYIQYSIIFTN